MTIRTSMLVLCMAAATQQVLAATVTFQWFGGRLTTAAEIANDPSLANQLVHDFRVTTSADILRVGDVRIHGGVHPYNNSFGTDVEPPNPLFLPVFPAVSRRLLDYDAKRCNSICRQCGRSARNRE